MKGDFEKYIRKHSLFGHGDKLLAAVSGGADSVAMVSLLHKCGYSFAIAHCNFGLRGGESDGDEAFVRELAHSYGAKFHARAFDTEGFAHDRGISIQMAARQLRYSWFGELRETGAYTCTALAHHADDNTETVLNNIIRGTGIRGLSGMAPKNGETVRPLLFARRRQVLAYINEEKLHYREDSSNMQVKYARNRLRHTIIPELEKLNPAFHQSMQQNIRNWEAHRLFFEQASKRFQEKHVVEHADGVSEIPANIVTDPVNQIFIHDFLSSHGFNTAQANKLIAKAKRKSGKRFISEGYIALTDRGRVLVKAIEEQKEPTYYIYESDNQINEPLKLNIRKFNSLDMGRISKAPGEAWFDAERLQFPLQLRKWRKGDRFRPLGMKGSKKLSDYFTDEKMSRFEKENTWLLCSGGAIAWVVGKRISESFKVGEKTKKVWNVQIVSK